MNLNKIFKETMDCLDVRGSDLAEISGRSRQNISEIRRGKANPSLNDFGELLDFAEKLKNGFVLEFTKRMAIEAVGKEKIAFFYADPQELIDSLSAEEQASLLSAIAESLRKNRLAREREKIALTAS